MHDHCRVIDPLVTALSMIGLVGCDKLTSTTTVRNLQDGVRTDRSWSQTWKDRAEFRCIASTSGQCNFVVFTSNCPAVPCSTRVVTEVALNAGESRKLNALPRGFMHCVAHDAKPVAPTCLKA